MRTVVVGAGRMGQGLALALHGARWPVALVARSPRPVVTPLTLHPGDWAPALAAAELVVVATPDSEIPIVAADLAQTATIGVDHVVVHLAGPLDRSALAALRPVGASLGSFHPLQTIADPSAAPERLRGAYAGIEGDARAVAAGEAMAAALGMTPVLLAADAKVLYHAAAVLTANYTVALAGVAARLAEQAGVPAALAEKMYQPLLAGAVANVKALGAAAALTGPIRRGDVATIRAHLAALQPEDRRLYAALGRAALQMARGAGLEEESAREIEALLRGVA